MPDPKHSSALDIGDTRAGREPRNIIILHYLGLVLMVVCREAAFRRVRLTYADLLDYSIFNHASW